VTPEQFDELVKLGATIDALQAKCPDAVYVVKGSVTQEMLDNETPLEREARLFAESKEYK
jgi:hypothetical protein